MERSCGKVDYRLQKIKHLEADSRSIILQKTQALGDNKPCSFRGFKAELEKVKELRLTWSERMQAAREKGYDEKQEIARQRGEET